MTRLFVALPVDEEIKTYLTPVYQYLERFGDILKFVEPENYHITIKFLGECEVNLSAAIEATFYEIPVIQEDIYFSVEGLGIFPDKRNPSVIYAGIKTDYEKISRLTRNVEAYASNFKFKKEKRELIPHLTIARIKKGRKIAGDLTKYIENNTDQVYGTSTFTRLSLFSSKLNKDGPVYSELKTIHF